MLRLVTIPISHYCEKARWALDRAGIEFEEDAHVQGVHVLYVKRAGGRTTAPVLVTPDGAVSDSTEILEWVDARVDSERRLYPEGGEFAEVRTLENELDEGFGVDGRRWMYARTAAEPELLERWGPVGLPRWEQRAFPVLFRFAKPLIAKRVDLRPEVVEASLGRVHRALDSIGERLSDGRRYLVGDRFTAADLTFASLAAAVIWPPDYGSPLPQPEDVSPALAEDVRAFRATPAGEFALRMFREERRA